jgi:hypothetical protein
MKKFYIDMAYVVDVSIREEHRIRQRADEDEADFIVRKLKSSNTPMYSISNKDHDEFTKLREQLGEEGYIKIDRSCWNADRVIETFFLNDVKFKPSEKFCCAAAMKWTLEHGKIDK